MPTDATLWEDKETKHIFSIIAIACVTVFLIGGCTAASKEPQRYEQTFFDVFDTVTTIAVYDTSETSTSQQINEAHALLTECHQLYDIYSAYDGINNLYTVNESAGILPVAVDERILDLVAFAKDMYALTDGTLNVAMGSVFTIWSDYRQSGLDDPDNATLPPMELLEQAAQHADIDDIVIDREAGTLYLADASMRIDVGALAKGYAVELVMAQMESEGVTSMLLSAGGNVRAIGTRPDGTSWKVGIQDPYSGGYIKVVNVDGKSLVTSGTYERYYTVGGVDYHHIIDPATLMPSTYYDSVSVLTADSGLADALTTGLFGMPPDKGKALVESLDGVEALWISQDGTETQSSGFSTYATDYTN
jgi:thiamine biosynthesis lipoprotein